MNIHLELAPWARVLADNGIAASQRDEARLCVLIDSGTCIIAAVDTMRARWGPGATKVVCSALRRGLGRVINVWDPNDLTWLAEHWVETLEYFDDDPESREFTIKRIQDFDVAAENVARSYLTPRADVRAALQALPSGPIRRSAAALLSEPRAPRAAISHPALDRIHATQGYPSAAVLLTKSPFDAVRHAYDEVQENAMNSGESSGPHAVVLLDTSSHARLAVGLRQLHRVLRTLAWGEHLVWAITELQS